MINVYWTDEAKTMIRLDYYPPIESWEEYQEAIDCSCQMAKSVSYSVSVVHNPGHAAMPRGNAFEQLRLAAKKTPSNVDYVLMVIHNRMARRIVRTGLYIVGLSAQYYFVQSLDEVDAFLSDRVASPR